MTWVSNLQSQIIEDFNEVGLVEESLRRQLIRFKYQEQLVIHSKSKKWKQFSRFVRRMERLRNLQKLQRQCPECHQPLPAQPSHLKTLKYCSPACMARYTDRRYKYERRWTARLNNRPICTWCQKSLPLSVRSDSKYCSVECRLAASIGTHK